MSNCFEAAVVRAGETALVQFLDDLPVRGLLIPFTLEAFRVGRGQFVIFAWRLGAERPNAREEIDVLADELSRQFGKAVAVHYDDQIGFRTAMLSLDGRTERCFGEPDEVWVPYGDDGNLLKSPRYAGNAVPEDVECDCIWNGIDEALKAAGFGRWMTSSKVVEVAQLDNPFWKRLGQ